MHVERLTTGTYSRRRVLQVGGAMTLAGFAARLLPSVVTAQAQPAAAETLGYPAITVNISDKEITGPAKFPAGLTHVTAKSTRDDGDIHLTWGRFPDGLGAEEVHQALAARPAEITPENDPLVPIAERMTFVGSPDNPTSGRDAVGIVPFREGRYAILDATDQLPPFFFEVTAPDPQAKTEEPAADVTLQMGNMVFLGLDDGVPAGKQTWKVENIDKTFHELLIAPIEASWTEDNFVEFLKDLMEGREDPSALPPTTGASGIQSPEMTSWHLFDIPAGHYVAVCFAPMSWTEYVPHALMGMVKVFDAK